MDDPPPTGMMTLPAIPNAVRTALPRSTEDVPGVGLHLRVHPDTDPGRLQDAAHPVDDAGLQHARVRDDECLRPAAVAGRGDQLRECLDGPHSEADAVSELQLERTICERRHAQGTSSTASVARAASASVTGASGCRRDPRSPAAEAVPVVVDR